MIDETWYSHCHRLSPEAPVPIAELDFKHMVIGGAGNVAANLKAITQDVDIIMCGAPGPNAIRLFDELGIQIWEGSKQLPARAENIKVRIVDIQTGYHIVRVDNESYHRSCIHDLSIPALLSFLEHLQPDAIILSDYLKGIVTEDLATYVIGYSTEANIPLLVDSRAPKQNHFYGASIITPNLREYNAICASTKCSGQQDIVNLLGLRLGLLLTKSKDGLEFYQKNGQVFSSPAVGNNVIDVTGAGDTVLAAVTGALLLGCQNWDRILSIANQLAYEVCMQRGTATPKHKLSEFQWE